MLYFSENLSNYKVFIGELRKFSEDLQAASEQYVSCDKLHAICKIFLGKHISLLKYKNISQNDANILYQIIQN